ncbi:MAG: hypothetical protein ACLQIQ_16155 [Beijerinckiaceae bacterium]
MNEAVATIRARLQQFSQVIAEFEQTVGGVKTRRSVTPLNATIKGLKSQ